MTLLASATATHGGDNMAVATGEVNENVDAVYFLDYKTGDLTAYVYYPRYQRFGAMYRSNITEQLPATKNGDYLLVTGHAITPAVASNNRPAQTLVYVVDVNSGQFAAYGLSYSQTLESAGQPQGGPLVFVGGGSVRAASAGGTSVPPPGGLPGVAPGATPNALPGANVPPGNAPALNPNAPNAPIPRGQQPDPRRRRP